MKNKALTLFPTGLRNLVIEWDTLSSQKQTVTRLLDGAWTVQMNEFDEFVFGDKRDELDAILKEVANEALGVTEDESKSESNDRISHDFESDLSVFELKVKFASGTPKAHKFASVHVLKPSCNA
jgi:hypothetical protein